MSKLTDAVSAVATGQVRPVNVAVSPDLVVESTKTDYSWQRALEYRISLACESRVWVTDAELFRGNGALEGAVREAKRSLVEAVFGEFRPQFRQLHRMLYEMPPGSDVEALRTRLRAFELQMFGGF
jgi:hypothetical protein